MPEITRTAPGWAAPQPPATPRPTGGGAPRGRLLLIAGIVGVVVLAGSALGAFALAGGFGSAQARSVPCGGFRACIPSLTVGEVMDVLRERGFECPERTSSYDCVLRTGANLYEMTLREDLLDEFDPLTVGKEGDGSELIAEVHLNTQFPSGEGQPTARTRNYVRWFATLPFTDPEDAAEVSAWVEEQIGGGRSANAVIGGYEYDLVVSPGRITLDFRGVTEE